MHELTFCVLNDKRLFFPLLRYTSEQGGSVKLTVSLRNFVDRKQNSCFLAFHISLRSITPIPQNMSSLIKEQGSIAEIDKYTVIDYNIDKGAIILEHFPLRRPFQNGGKLNAWLRKDPPETIRRASWSSFSKQILCPVLEWSCPCRIRQSCFSSSMIVTIQRPLDRND